MRIQASSLTIPTLALLGNLNGASEYFSSINKSLIGASTSPVSHDSRKLSCSSGLRFSSRPNCFCHGALVSLNHLVHSLERCSV